MHSTAKKNYMRFLLILLISAMICGCSGQQDKLIGKYRAVNMGPKDSVAVTLELLADGKGFWSMEIDNAPFRWDLYQNRIRLHTKSGGVIEGTIDKYTILLTLPGMGLIHFQRS